MGHTPKLLPFTTDDIERLLKTCLTIPIQFKQDCKGKKEYKHELFAIILDEKDNIVIQGCKITISCRRPKDVKTLKYINTSKGFINIDSRSKLSEEPLDLDGYKVYSNLDDFLTNGNLGDYLLFRKLSASTTVDKGASTYNRCGKTYTIENKNGLCIGKIINY